MFSDVVIKAKEYVESIFTSMDQDTYLYHNYKHTMEVFHRVTYLGEKEGLNDDLIELLQLAALFHDSGFVLQYDDNEKIGLMLMKDFFVNDQGIFNKERLNFENVVDQYFNDDIDYPQDRLDIIKQLILVTIPNKEPQNKLEQIIKDADLDNFGREDFFENGYRLKVEMKNIKGLEFKDLDWYEHVYEMLMVHQFYTATQIAERGEQYQKNLNIVKEELKKLNSKKIFNLENKVVTL